jgi:hypothetical protein
MRRALKLLSLATVVAALAGCTLPIEGGCDSKAEPAPISGCLVPVDGWPEDGPTPMVEGVELELSGVVLATGTGEPADQCLSEGGPIGHLVGFGGALGREDITWIEFESDEGDVYRVAITADVHTPVFEVGEELDISFGFRFGGFSPDVGHLEIRDVAGGLVGWVGEAGAFEQLSLPAELEQIAQGPIVCSERDTGCGDWRAYDLDVTVDGQQAVVPYGAITDVGDLAFAHGGYEQETDTVAATCMDWFVAHVAVGLFPAL